jgi:Cu/Ag efflux protein CusF
MKTISACIVAFLVSAGIAFASTTKGPIKAIDAKKHTVTLMYDDTYTFDPKTDLSKFKVGETVHITFTGKNQASAIEKAAP